MTDMPLAHLTVLDLTAHRAGPDRGAPTGGLGRPGDQDRAARLRPRRCRRRQPSRVRLPEPAPQQARHDAQPQERRRGAPSSSSWRNEADVVVENYRSDVKHRLGVDYEAVAKINPRIVYGSISGFGQTGPDATRPGVDQIAQGMGGLMSITGLPGQGPVRVGIPIADLTSGLAAGAGHPARPLPARANRPRPMGSHLAAGSADLHARLPGGALADLGRGRQAGRQRPSDLRPDRRIPDQRRTHQYRRRGRQACGSGSAPRSANRSCRPCPSSQPAQLRSKNRKALNERLAAITREKPSAHWIKALNEAGIPCGAINSIDQTFAEPQVQHLAIARPVRHPELGDIKVVGQPINMSAAPQPAAMRPTPELGQHTGEVLESLGYSAKAIADLRARAVV